MTHLSIPDSLQSVLCDLNAHLTGRAGASQDHARQRAIALFGASERLIVYGSLAPGRENHHELATLAGEWTLGWIRGELLSHGWGAQLGYRALRWRADGERVDAWLLCSPGLPAEWTRLDAFEGAAYQRQLAPFETDAGVVAVGYVYSAAVDAAAQPQIVDAAKMERVTRKSSDEWVAGASYENFMGRWSRQLAPRFVSWLPVHTAAHWVDIGCGSGALTDAICAGARPASVVACDPSESFVEYARQQQVDPRVSFVVAGVGQLPKRPGGFESVASLLALNFFPEPEAAIQEMRRITAAGGLVSACVWDYAGRMEFLRRFWDSVAALDPNAAGLDEGYRFPICRPDALESLFCNGDLGEVVCESIARSSP